MNLNLDTKATKNVRNNFFESYESLTPRHDFVDDINENDSKVHNDHCDYKSSTLAFQK